MQTKFLLLNQNYIRNITDFFKNEDPIFMKSLLKKK